MPASLFLAGKPAAWRETDKIRSRPRIVLRRLVGETRDYRSGFRIYESVCRAGSRRCLKIQKQSRIPRDTGLRWGAKHQRQNPKVKAFQSPPLVIKADFSCLNRIPPAPLFTKGGISHGAEWCYECFDRQSWHVSLILRILRRSLNPRPHSPLESTDRYKTRPYE
jgi:hypothetical protein